jgi:hypothetical protein
MTPSSNLSPKSTFLRRVLMLDAVATGATALLAVALASTLAGWLGLPAGLLRGAGLILIPFVALVAWTAARAQTPAGAVWTIIAMNGAWVIASVGLLLSGLVAPTLWGTAFVIAQAVVVGAFAELQIIGVRRAAAAAAG